MASYDSPAAGDKTPAGAVVQSTGYPGSTPGGIPDTSAEPTMGTVGNSALVIPSGGSVINGDRVTVGPMDTNVGGQADLYTGSDANPLSSISGDYAGHTGIGGGSYSHTHGGAA